MGIYYTFFFIYIGYNSNNYFEINNLGYIANSQVAISKFKIYLEGIMNSVVELNVENGTYIFKLKDVLESKNISINKLMRDTNTDFKVIKRLINGEIIKIDIYVLARICNYLNCNITDIFDYKRK